MAKRDYYEVLGVDRNAGPADLKKAFRQRALRYHPDRNNQDPQAEEKFKEAAEAYEVLRDPEKRQRYDLYGHAGLAGGGMGSAADFGDIFSAFSDIFGGGSVFDSFFAQGRAQGARRGAHRRLQMEISLAEVARGVEKSIVVNRSEYCDECAGTGLAPGTQPTTCPYCRGVGQVQHRQGFFTVRETCPQCRGQGHIIEHPCHSCQGQGRQAARTTISVEIPAGVESGQRLILRGEGDVGEPGAPRGDLFIDIRVKPHEIFERHGEDVVCEVPLSFAQAALGTEIEVPTLTGRTSLAIPRGTQSGRVFRLKGQGLPNVHGHGVGSQLVRVIVEVPRHLTAGQEELLRQFAETEDANVSPRRKSFFEKVKRYFEAG